MPNTQKQPNMHEVNYRQKPTDVADLQIPNMTVIRH